AIHGNEPWVFQPIHFSVSASSSTTAATAFSVTVTDMDEFYHVLTVYTGTVHFSSTDARAILPANYTFTGADMGAHTFSATLKTAGSQSITPSETPNTRISRT